VSTFTKPFTKPLIVSYVGEKNKTAIWEIQEEFVYFVGSLDSDEEIIVPIGLRTDFASIPKALWSIFPPTGKYVKAAVVHDYLTTYKGSISIRGKEKNYSKKQVDQIFLEAMKVLGVSLPIRRAMYYSVRLFGDSSGYKS
jgi:hypothetical protein